MAIIMLCLLVWWSVCRGNGKSGRNVLQKPEEEEEEEEVEEERRR